MERSIIIDGRPKVWGKGQKYRHLITVSGVDIWLTFMDFAYITKLANRRQSEIADGWLHKLDLQFGCNQYKYLYHLRTALAESSVDTYNFIERDGKGCFRLTIRPKLIKIKWRTLVRIGDHELTVIANQCRKRERNVLDNSLTSKIKG